MSMGGTSAVGATDPVSMATASTSQSVDQGGSGPDGGAHVLQSLLNLGTTFGTQVIAGNQAQQQAKNNLALAQIQGRTATSQSSMLIIGAIAVVVLLVVMRGK